jgi:hypothetical protein
MYAKVPLKYQALKPAYDILSNSLSNGYLAYCVTTYNTAVIIYMKCNINTVTG